MFCIACGEQAVSVSDPHPAPTIILPPLSHHSQSYADAAENLCSRSTSSGADSADTPTNPKPTATNDLDTPASRLELDDRDKELARLRREVKTLQMENQNVFWLADEVKRLKRELLAMTPAAVAVATA